MEHQATTTYELPHKQNKSRCKRRHLKTHIHTNAFGDQRRQSTKVHLVVLRLAAIINSQRYFIVKSSDSSWSLQLCDLVCASLILTRIPNVMFCIILGPHSDSCVCVCVCLCVCVCVCVSNQQSFWRSRPPGRLTDTRGGVSPKRDTLISYCLTPDHHTRVCGEFELAHTHTQQGEIKKGSVFN